jgi:hypothetical protein
VVADVVLVLPHQRTAPHHVHHLVACRVVSCACRVVVSERRWGEWRGRRTREASLLTVGFLENAPWAPSCIMTMPN